MPDCLDLKPWEYRRTLDLWQLEMGVIVLLEAVSAARSNLFTVTM